MGHERFDGLSKKIGARELFFVALLFRSTRTHNFAGQIITVVPEDDVSQELLKWSEAQHLRFTGLDRNKPAHRVAKMWREFVQQMGKERKLDSLFTDVHRSVTGERLYALRLRPAETQILVASIPALFQSRPASR